MSAASAIESDVRVLTTMMFRYCELFDDGDFEAFAALFEHGEWHTAGTGAEAARRWIEQTVLLYDGIPRTRHVTTNVVVEVADDGATARGRAYVTVFQALPDFPLQPIFAGRYRDRFTRVDGSWQWTQREIIGDLRGDMSHHVLRSRGS